MRAINRRNLFSIKALPIACSQNTVLCPFAMGNAKQTSIVRED